MTDLDLLLAIAGVAVTVMVVAGMILITPRGQVEVHRDDSVPGTDAPPGPVEARRGLEPAPRSAGREAST